VPTSCLAAAADLARAVADLAFAPPVACVYNPLDYAWEPHAAYLDRWGRGRREVLLVGMNPGPWGMAQTGVPFGEVAAVRDWLGITGAVRRPVAEHPRRPVEGFSCRRSEVSGRRLWSWARTRFVRPERFFARFFVLNYCPLLFLEASGRNRTPAELPAGERAALGAACDRALAAAVRALEPCLVVGVGRFAETAARRALAGQPTRVGGLLHPSPASPAANRDWAAAAERALGALGVAL
jgi:single-strand selective monofunctional uracil DNA glycosylase